jgi:hypothetical protein
MAEMPEIGGGSLLLVATLLLAGCGAPDVPPIQTPVTTPPPPSARSFGPEGDFRAASEALTEYMTRVNSGNYAAAWGMLAPGTQAAFGSEEQFARDRLHFMLSAGGTYRLGRPSHDLARLSQWVVPSDPSMPPLDRAFVAQVDYPNIDSPAGWDILVTAPDPSGNWLVWILR